MQNKEIPDLLGDAVKEYFGLDYLFPYQRLVITNIIEAAQGAGISIKWPQGENEEGGGFEEDLLLKENLLTDIDTLGRQIVILPTGAGKSLCFQLPAMLIDGITLVIYPILSLMADQERRLAERGFNPVIIRGGQSKEERNEIWEKLKSGQSRFIIANPEVLLTSAVKEQLGTAPEKINITHIVIDEAHCVSEWGESFRPSYLEIGSLINSLKPPLITAFTATASAPVLEKIKNYIFGDLDVNQITGNPDRPNIKYSAKGCINRNLAVRDLLLENARPAIVFCSSRPGTEKLAVYLRNEFLQMGLLWHDEIRFYHAGLSKEEKTNVEKWFLLNKEAVLCATCAFGMGVDKADIRTVVHRDCPPSVESYLQEAGRAGRDGGESKAVLLWGPQDDDSLKRANTEAGRIRISALLNYAKDINLCRRHSLLALLNFNANNEVPQTPCCDVCEKEASLVLREECTVMDFFRKNKRRFTVNKAAAVLAASKNIRWTEDEAKLVIEYLINNGKIKKHNRFPWKKRLSG